MSNIKKIRSLSGHSGCHIDLCDKEGQVFVRKNAGKESYNLRLKKQMIKQKYFNLEKVKTPAIFNYGKDGNIFYFDMEFINGITLSEYMHKIKIKEIIDLMGTLFQSLPIDKAQINLKANSIFQEKIASLKRVIDLTNKNIKQSVDILEKFDFSKVPYSHCCGDLTLENILLSSSGIYIIDLLDSFYNSWMIDVAKILQDIDLGWSYRHSERNYNLNLRLEVAKQALFDNLLALPDGRVQLNIIYHILLLNILRIYPYAKDTETLAFLDNALQKLIRTIYEMEPQ